MPARRWRRRLPRRSSRGRRTRIRAGCSRACRAPAVRFATSRATSRASSPHPRAAASIRAATTPPRSAARAGRRPARSPRTMACAATIPSMRRSEPTGERHRGPAPRDRRPRPTFSRAQRLRPAHRLDPRRRRRLARGVAGRDAGPRRRGRLPHARILTRRRRMVILDEPTSGLDVSVQASVLKLFGSLQEAFALTYVFISHDLAVVRAMCARIAVMYLGTIVELGETAAIFAKPSHPYTQSLLAAVPRIGGRRVTFDFTLEGEPPNPRAVPSGCRFRTRCPLAQDVCTAEEPPLR